jgi:ParB/RepB/Spo0J family partition protein
MNTTKTPAAAAASQFVSLKAAAEDKANPAVGKETTFKVDPRVIEIQPGFNRPISREHVEQLKTSIRNGATLPPIFVRVEPGRIIMVDGEHRWIAVMELIADGMEIPFMSAIQFRGSDADAIAHLLTSAQGQAISPLDQGIQYLKLVRLHWDVKMIAARTGKSTTHIENCLTLAEANTDVQQAVRNGEVASSLAVDLVKEHGPEAGKVIQTELVKAKDSGKTKVTRASVQGRAVPRKLVDRVESNMRTLFESRPDLTAEGLAELPEGASVSVPAALLAELRAAHDEVQKMRAKEAAAAAAAPQAPATPEEGTGNE